ncbi:MAG: hypothetical protein KA791_10295 [Flavobacteriales bacterium]|nr:hypothetical protein [Flavobacteriales bacterium]
MEPAVFPRTIDTMPAHARVWVYKSAKPFTPQERQAILERGLAFTNGWAAHGAALDACVDVLHDHFVVIAVDEQQAMASGCSIDKSVRLVQELERDLSLNLTDRMVVLYEAASGIQACRVPDVEGLIRSGELNADTPVYDDLVSTCGDLQARFRSPLRATWLARSLQR